MKQENEFQDLVDRMVADAELTVAASGMQSLLKHGWFGRLHNRIQATAEEFERQGMTESAALLREHPPVFEGFDEFPTCFHSAHGDDSVIYPCITLRRAHNGAGTWDELVSNYPDNWTTYDD